MIRPGSWIISVKSHEYRRLCFVKIFNKLWFFWVRQLTKHSNTLVDRFLHWCRTISSRCHFHAKHFLGPWIIFSKFCRHTRSYCIQHRSSWFILNVSGIEQYEHEQLMKVAHKSIRFLIHQRVDHESGGKGIWIFEWLIHRLRSKHFMY